MLPNPHRYRWGAEGTGSPGCGARGRWRGLARQHTDTPDRLEAAARPAGPGRASSRRAERSSRRGRGAGGQAARRPEICRGNKQQLAARTARGRAAAHGHNQQPGPNRPRGARNTGGATSNMTPPRMRKPRPAYELPPVSWTSKLKSREWEAFRVCGSGVEA